MAVIDNEDQVRKKPVTTFVHTGIFFDMHFLSDKNNIQAAKISF